MVIISGEWSIQLNALPTYSNQFAEYCEGNARKVRSVAMTTENLVTGTKHITLAAMKRITAHHGQPYVRLAVTFGGLRVESHHPQHRT
jgi:hypothetical protein